MITALTIWTTLDNVKTSIFTEHMDGMSHVATFIAAVTAGLAILKNYNGFVKGDGIDFMLIFKLHYRKRQTKLIIVIEF